MCASVRTLFVILFALTVLPALSRTSVLSAQSIYKPAEPIHLSVTVTNKSGESVDGLAQENFRVSIDKKPARIIAFGQNDLPISVGIVLDSSGSMGGPTPKDTQEKSAFKKSTSIVGGGLI
jgi:hypothetical protein